MDVRTGDGMTTSALEACFRDCHSEAGHARRPTQISKLRSLPTGDDIKTDERLDQMRSGSALKLDVYVRARRVLPPVQTHRQKEVTMRQAQTHDGELLRCADF